MQADVERFLARLFVDAELRERFLGDPLPVARQHGLSAQECQAVAAMPAEDVRRAARSFDHKRQSGQRSGQGSGQGSGHKSARPLQAVRDWLRRLSWRT